MGEGDFFKGITDGKHAFCGPRLLQIDITNNCNTNCVGCWCHSDYLGDKKITDAEKKKYLPLTVIQQIIADARELNVEGIQLAGSGEPLLHPDICEIIRRIKDCGMELEVVTNGILLNEKIARCMVDCAVDRVVVSVWAGTPAMYTKIHPNQPEKTFGVLKENLMRLAAFKKQKKRMPAVRIYHVVSHFNCREIEAMFDFAIAVSASRVEFQALDVIEGKTDFLRLTNSDVSAVEKQFKKISARKDRLMVNKFDHEEFNEFGRFIIKDADNDGFRYFFDDVFFYDAVCPVGNPAITIHENMALSCLDFFFDKQLCAKCVQRKNCSIDTHSFAKTVYFMSAVGINTFLRRIKNAGDDDGAYDAVVNAIPCYAGWDFARILTNGDVIPCCKGCRMPMGNVEQNSFKTIWHSEIYNTFREKAKAESKTTDYFKVLECTKGCDNYGRNSAIHYVINLRDKQGLS